MLRIYNSDELKRILKVLSAHDNSTVKFPIDLFKDSQKVAVLQYGEENSTVYSYTSVDGEAVIESNEGRVNHRSGWLRREREFRELMKESGLEV